MLPMSPNSVLMYSFVMCPLSPPRFICGHFWMMQNPVEPGRTMALLDRKSNEAWNQYVRSCLTRGMLGNGVSGVLWSYFNHRDLGKSTNKQTGSCQNPTTLWDVCCGYVSVITFYIIEFTERPYARTCMKQKLSCLDFFACVYLCMNLLWAELWDPNYKHLIKPHL